MSKSRIYVTSETKDEKTTKINTKVNLFKIRGLFAQEGTNNIKDFSKEFKNTKSTSLHHSPVTVFGNYS